MEWASILSNNTCQDEGGMKSQEDAYREGCEELKKE